MGWMWDGVGTPLWSAQIHASESTPPHPHLTLPDLYHVGQSMGGMEVFSRTSQPHHPTLPHPTTPPPRPADLYHVDHFMGGMGNFCKELINCSSYSIGPQQQLPDGSVAFRVTVNAGSNGGEAVFDFVLQRQEWGLRRGSWQTKSLTRAEGEGA